MKPGGAPGTNPGNVIDLAAWRPLQARGPSNETLSIVAGKKDANVVEPGGILLWRKERMGALSRELAALMRRQVDEREDAADLMQSVLDLLQGPIACAEVPRRVASLLAELPPAAAPIVFGVLREAVGYSVIEPRQVQAIIRSNEREREKEARRRERRET